MNINRGGWKKAVFIGCSHGSHMGIAGVCSKLIRCKRALELIMKLIEMNRKDITQEDISAISEICKRVLKEMK